MTTRRYEDWGQRGPLPEGCSTVDSDAAAALIAGGAVSGGRTAPPIRLTGGDLWRTLGGSDAAPGGDDRERWLLPVDLGRADFDDGSVSYFIAHLVARGRTWWAAPQVVVMNAEFCDGYRLAPAAHPGDGHFDVTDGGVPRGQRSEARRRSRDGAHLEHPELVTSRRASLSVEWDRPRDIWADGIRVGPHRAMSVELIPDAVTVVL